MRIPVLIFSDFLKFHFFSPGKSLDFLTRCCRVNSRRQLEFFGFLGFFFVFLVFLFSFSLKMGERKYEFMTRINGKVYGLDDFMDRHPGGRDMIALGQDRDSTGRKRGQERDIRKGQGLG